MHVVDASVWVSRLVPQDVHHTVSRDWLRQASGDILAEPILLLSELAGAIARRTRQAYLGRQAVRRVLAVPTLRLTAVDRELGSLAAALAADYRLRGADAVYAALAYRLNIPLVTWDNEQIMRLQGVIQVGVPEEV